MKKLAISKDALVTLTPEREEVLQGLKNAAHAAYIDSIRLCAAVGAAVAFLFGIAAGFIHLWTWQILGNIAVTGVFLVMCLLGYSYIPSAKEYFFAEELAYRDTGVGSLIGGAIEGLLLVAMILIVMVCVILGWMETNLLVYAGWIVLKLSIIVSCGFVIRRTISF